MPHFNALESPVAECAADGFRMGSQMSGYLGRKKEVADGFAICFFYLHVTRAHSALFLETVLHPAQRIGNCPHYFDTGQPAEERHSHVPALRGFGCIRSRTGAMVVGSTAGLSQSVVSNRALRAAAYAALDALRRVSAARCGFSLDRPLPLAPREKGA